MKKKQQYLYHGSERKNLYILKPRQKEYRSKEEGKVIFATQYKGLAATFIPRGHAIISVVSRKPVIIISNKKDFIRKDRGGAIYRFNKSPLFIRHKHKDYLFGNYEFVARRNLKPIDKKVYDSSIDAMIDNGVIVYFVNRKQKKEYVKLIDGGKPVRSSKLHAFFSKLKSENEKHGMKKYWWR